MKMKTSELIDRALNWAVVRANYGINYETVWRTCRVDCNYSTDWRQGGPIIDREWISIEAWPNEHDEDSRWVATRHEQPAVSEEVGPTPLIAAMRCYVAAMLGDEVELPEELVK